MNDILQKPMDHARMTAVLQQLKSPQLRVSHIGVEHQGTRDPRRDARERRNAVLFVGGPYTV